MTALPLVVEIVLWLLSLSLHPPPLVPVISDTLHDGVQRCDSFFTIQLQQQNHHTGYMYMGMSMNGRGKGGGGGGGGGRGGEAGGETVLLMTVINHTHTLYNYYCACRFLYKL